MSYTCLKKGGIDNELTTEGFDITELGFQQRELDDVIGIPSHIEETPIEESVTEFSGIIKRGDLIELGSHRMLCGDSTLEEDVSLLMNGKLADMVFTDPPYGVNVKGGKNKSNIAGDLTQTAIPFSFEQTVVRATAKNARLYFCGGEGNIGLYSKLFERFISQIPRHLIWKKNGFVMKPNGYHNGYEIIFYGYKSGGGGMETWFGPRTEDYASDVWVISRDASNTYDHPTQKPVALPARAITNSCQPCGLVYDCFLGSGSTLLACEHLGRVCYGLEIEPKYCELIISRYQKACKTSGKEFECKINGEPFKPVQV